MHYDAIRGGIWSFLPSSSDNELGVVPNLLTIASHLEIELVERESGVYEPSSTVKGRQVAGGILASGISSPTSGEGSLRHSQALNVRAVQQNGAPSHPDEQIPAGKFSASVGEQPGFQTFINDHIISAVLGAIVSQLCHKSGFIPLNSRTLLLPANQLQSTHPRITPTDNQHEVMVASLDISLTSLGSLVVKIQCEYSPHLKSLGSYTRSSSGSGNTVPGAALWLAPGGIAAQFQVSEAEKQTVNSGEGMPCEDLVKGSTHTVTTAQMQSWKSNCLEWLSQKGLDNQSFENEPWVIVRVHRHDYKQSDLELSPASFSANGYIVVPWPSRFCFLVSNQSQDHSSGKGSIIDGRDPLYFAESWYSSKDERTSVLAKRKREQQHEVERLQRDQVDVETRIAQPVTSSPMAFRRNSNAGTIYPTPPDALHHHLGATPNFDSSGLTPGPGNTNSSVDGNVPMPPSHPVPDVGSEMWTAPEKKDQQSGAEIYHDNDDLFGENDEDLFGTDVTDADFSFFDQPDDFPMLEKPSTFDVDDHPSQGPDPTHTKSVTDDIVIPCSEDVDMELGSLPTSPQNSSRGVELRISEETDSHLSTAAILPEEDSRGKQHAESSLQSRVVSPHFDKGVIFNRFLQSSDSSHASQTAIRSSRFEKIHFEPLLSSFDRKYGDNGQFSFNGSKIFSTQSKSLAASKQRLHITQRRDSHPEASQSALDELLSVTTDDGSPSGSGSSSKSISNNAPLDEYSQTHSASINFKNIWTLGSSSAVKIRSPRDGVAAADFEASGNSSKPSDYSQFGFLDENPTDWSLSPFLAAPEVVLDDVHFTDTECIAIAQTVADQAVSGTLKVSDGSLEVLDQAMERRLKAGHQVHALIDSIRMSFAYMHKCNLRTFLDVQGIPTIQAARLPPRPILPPRGLSSLDLPKAINPFLMALPRLELRRAESKLSVLPSAVNFWDNLGLGPPQGGKDITAVCVCPNAEGVSLFANYFLDQMRSSYESFRLGTHDRLICKELTYGLVPYNMEGNRKDTPRFLGMLKDIVGKLGKVFASYAAEEKNIVVYFAYPTDDARLLVSICSAFQHLFAMYRKALLENKMSTTNELVLQLVPLDFISSCNSIVVPTSHEYSRLAIEVYDRCVSFSSSSSAPAVLLEQPLPKVIDFKLSANPSAALLQENTCLHIAYAQSIDDRWVTAAWTDNKGAQQMTASYCLGRKGEPMSTGFGDIANEIWATTMEYIASKRIHWRLMIVRVGSMDYGEMSIWTRLANHESDSKVSLTLITVRPEPSLCLLPNPTTLVPNVNPPQSVLTPASTPQPTQTNFSSQDNVSTPTKEAQNASTPIETQAELDNDMYLVDCTDQAWGAVLSHRLNSSNSLLEINPALISGYLIKRGGTSPENAPVLMEVNIVHSDVVGNPRTFHESLLKEVLTYYRGLGTLAKVRGIIDPVGDCRPWHVAAVEKAVRALYILM